MTSSSPRGGSWAWVSWMLLALEAVIIIGIALAVWVGR